MEALGGQFNGEFDRQFARASSSEARAIEASAIEVGAAKVAAAKVGSEADFVEAVRPAAVPRAVEISRCRPKSGRAAAGCTCFIRPRPRQKTPSASITVKLSDERPQHVGDSARGLEVRHRELFSCRLLPLLRRPHREADCRLFLGQVFVQAVAKIVQSQKISCLSGAAKKALHARHP